MGDDEYKHLEAQVQWLSASYVGGKQNGTDILAQLLLAILSEIRAERVLAARRAQLTTR